jgi:hypothetical protein
MTDKLGGTVFRIGGLVLILLGMAHSLSLFEQPAPANETERQLQNLMSNYKFDLLGSQRTMDNLFRGLSICFIIAAIGLGTMDLVISRERAVF